MTPKQLTALATELKLTPLRKRFCEILAADPDRNQTQALRAAGYEGTEKSAVEEASRMSRAVNVQNYLTALTAGAVAKAEEQAGYRMATLGEAIQVLTDQIRSSPGDYLTDDGALDLGKIKKAPKGVVVALDLERKRFRMSDPQGAAEKLVRFHTGDYAREREPQKPTVNFNFMVLSIEELRTLKALRAKLVSGATEAEKTA